MQCVSLRPKRHDLIVKFVQGTDLMFLQIDDRLSLGIDIISFSPYLIAFSFSRAQLGFNVDQPLNLAGCIVTTRNLRNMDILPVQTFGI